MSLSSQLQAAATKAQSVVAQMSGMDPTAAGNFIGPDGQPYTMTFRPADAFEAEAASREMTLHGYTDRSVVMATATRTQFIDAPLNWRRKTGARQIPAPQQECLIASVSVDDPLFFGFVLLFRQAVSPGS